MANKKMKVQNIQSNRGQNSYQLDNIFMNRTKQALQIKTLQFINPQALSQSQQRKNRSSSTANSKSKQIDSVALKRFKSGRLLKKNITAASKPSERNGQQEVAQRIHQNIENRRLIKSENGKRSVKLKFSQSPASSRKFIRSQTVCRYEPTPQDEEQNISFVVNYSQEGEKKKRPFTTASDIPQRRIRTDTSQSIDIKDQMMKRVAKKIDFMKIMTITDEKDTTPKKRLSEKGEKKDTLFKFDKFYDHCLKNINKCLNTYDKNLNKQKDRKYYELKVQGTILEKELKEIREILLSKRPKQIPQQTNMGVVGNNIDVRTAEKMQSYRTNGGHYKKKLKKVNLNNHQIKNPFKMDNMQGWEIGLERTEDFYL